jgi:hypothetical protein
VILPLLWWLILTILFALNSFPPKDLRTLCRQSAFVHIFAPLESMDCALFCAFLHSFAQELLRTLLESMHSALFAKNRGCGGRCLGLLESPYERL